jgi:hypothetical protein
MTNPAVVSRMDRREDGLLDYISELRAIIEVLESENDSLHRQLLAARGGN